MKLSSLASVIALAALLPVTGCGAADESLQPSTGASATSAATSASSTGVDATTDAEVSTTSADPATIASAVTSSVEPTLESTAVPPATTPAAASSQPTTSAPSAAEFPTTFAEPEEIEALGYATNPLCEVLSVDEVTALLGTAVQPAIDDAAGTGCLWNATAGDAGFLQLQMVGDPARYLPPGNAETVVDIGDAAWVGKTEGGWTAQAQNPDGTFAVRVSGATAAKEAAVQGLRRLLERY